MGPKKSILWEMHVEGKFYNRTWDPKQAAQFFELSRTSWFKDRDVVIYTGSVDWKVD